MEAHGNHTDFAWRRALCGPFSRSFQCARSHCRSSAPGDIDATRDSIASGSGRLPCPSEVGPQFFERLGHCRIDLTLARERYPKIQVGHFVIHQILIFQCANLIKVGPNAKNRRPRRKYR
jgi:hypothetical protein